MSQDTARDIAHDALGGSWIFESGVLGTYTPISGGRFTASESVFNFDWSLGGAKPAATHGTALIGLVKEVGNHIKYVEIAYGLDKDEKAVYIMKVTGEKIFQGADTMSVENSVVHVYNDPSCNPVTDLADFTIPESGTFPPVRGYRIRF